MQSVERREPKPIRAWEQMEKLSHELRRTRMRRVPCVDENQKIGADQSQTSTWSGLVDHNLRASRIQNAAVHDVSVYVMQAHGAGVVSGHAAELKGISLRHGHPH